MKYKVVGVTEKDAYYDYPIFTEKYVGRILEEEDVKLLSKRDDGYFSGKTPALLDPTGESLYFFQLILEEVE